MLRVRTLGGLSVQRDGVVLDGSAAQPRRLALLALIARAGDRGITRDKLLTLLWPDASEEQGRRTLNQALYALRKDVGADELFGGVQELRLNPAVAECDVTSFELAIRRGELEQAAALYEGPFLDGFRLPGAEEFERWVEEERQALALRFAGSLERLARDAAQRADSAGAVRWWRRRASLDPLSARVAIELMEALAAAGERVAALRHARIYEALMAQELDLPPDGEVIALAERLRVEAPAPRPASAGAAAEPGAGSGADPGAAMSDALSAATPPFATSSSATSSATTRPAATSSSETSSATPHSVATSSPPTPAAVSVTSESTSAPVPAAPATSDTVTAAGVAASSRRRRWPQPAGRTAWAVLAVIVIATGGWFALQRLGDPAGVGSIHHERLLLADLAPANVDTVLAAVATEALRADLAQSRVLVLLEPAQVRAVLRRMDRPAFEHLDAELAREVALREGIRAFITGEVGRAGSGYVFTARIVAAESGDVLAAARETAQDSTVIIAALDRLSRRLRSLLGESVRQIRRTEPLAQVTTASLEALRLYTTGNRAMLVDGDYARAIALLEQAIELDPHFASAYRSLAGALANVGADPGRRAHALARAFDLRDRLGERERHNVAAAWYRLIGDHDRAIAEFTAALELTVPGTTLHLATLNNLGLLYTERGDPVRAAAAFREAITHDSASASIPLMNLQRALHAQGRADSARLVIDALERGYGTSPMVLIARAGLEGAEGRHANAEVYARQLLELSRTAPVWRTGSQRMLAHLAAIQGRLMEAEALLEHAADAAFESGDAVNGILMTLDAALLAAHVRGDRANALKRVDAALARTAALPAAAPAGGAGGGWSAAGPSEAALPHLPLALFFALVEQPAQSREWLARHERATAPELQRGSRRLFHLARGALELAEGSPAAALPYLRMAEQGTACGTCVLPLLGLALEQTGDFPAAIAAYERYLAASWPDRAAPWAPGSWDASGDAIWRATVLRRLAALHAASGANAAAAERLGELRQLWAGADPGLRRLLP